MNFSELMPALRELPRADKFRAVQFLTTELAEEEGAGLLSGMEYPVWSPYDATDAAATLTLYLREQTGSN
jgi:transcriptional regulator of aromatic amino acid metabolism